jgi:hypothetical protein
MESLYNKIRQAEKISRNPYARFELMTSEQAQRFLQIKRVLVDERVWSESGEGRDGKTIDTLYRELKCIRAAFRKYERSHGRNAVYEYLEAVFALVSSWFRQGSELWHARWCLLLKGKVVPRALDPFAAVILCTVDRRKIHRLTVSKWARALARAIKHKPQDSSLPHFVQGLGGINKAAAKASRLRRRRRR